MTQEYISGMGKKSTVPEEIKGWNWGAFLLNWIWGIGNSTFISLLMFVPVINIIMIFILGMKGNEWAWRNRIWRDVEHFKSTQKKWRNAGVILFLVIIPLTGALLINMLKGDAYTQSIKEIKSNPQVIEMIGANPKPEFLVVGKISHGSQGGSAKLNYSIYGTKGSAEVYLYATKHQEKWELKELFVISEQTGDKLVILTQYKKV